MVIAIIPAKMHSDRCPEKNWRPFLQYRSLTERMIRKLKNSELFNRVIVSTDFDPPLATKYENAPVIWRVRPFPKRRWMTSDEVAMDALDELDIPIRDDDIYVFCQPTSPNLSVARVVQALKLIEEGERCVITVNPAYKPAGSLYAGLIGDLRASRSLFRKPLRPIMVDWFEAIDIDYECDFVIAQSTSQEEL